MRAQEHDRQGRVPADRRARAPLREYPRPTCGTRRTGTRPAARPPGRARRACSAGWRCCGAGAPGAAAPGFPRPGRTSSWAPTSRSAGRSSAATGTWSRSTFPLVPGRYHLGVPEAVALVRREHDRRRGDHGLDDGRLLRAGRGPGRGAGRAGRRRPAAPTCRSTWTGRPAGSSRRSCSRRSSGTSGCRGSPRSTPRGTSTAWSTRASAGCIWRDEEHLPAGAGLQGQLPRRRDADVRAELLPARRAGRRAVLQLPAARLTTATGTSSRPRRTSPGTCPARSPSWARSSC